MCGLWLRLGLFEVHVRGKGYASVRERPMSAEQSLEGLWRVGLAFCDEQIGEIKIAVGDKAWMECGKRLRVGWRES